MAGCALFLTLLLSLSEALYFKTCNFDFYVIFPTILNCKYSANSAFVILRTFVFFSIPSAITLVGLIYIPRKLRIWDLTPITYQDDEGAMLLKKMNGFKKRRKNQQQFYHHHQQQDADG